MKTLPRVLLGATVVAGALFLGDGPARAACKAAAEEGEWINANPVPGGVTRIVVGAQCQEAGSEGHPRPAGPPFYIQIFSQCDGADCDWGKSGATRDESGALWASIRQDFVTRTLTLKASVGYGEPMLKMALWHDYRDQRTDTWEDAALRQPARAQVYGAMPPYGAPWQQPGFAPPGGPFAHGLPPGFPPGPPPPPRPQ